MTRSIIKVRSAELGDADFLFRLRTDPVTSAQLLQPPPESLSKHKEWLDRKLSDRGFLFLIAMVGPSSVGYFRLDSSGDISICVAPEFRGQGYAHEIILAGIAEAARLQPNLKEVFAVIRSNNVGSLKSFERAGFEFVRSASAPEGGEIRNFRFPISNYAVACSKLWIDDLPQNIAAKLGARIVLFQNKEDLSLERLKSIKPKAIFFPHWSFLIPAEVFESYPCVMFHMTDLPWGRGGSPLQNLIQMGLRETVISCFLCTAGLDTGPIFFKRPLVLGGSAQEIFVRASHIISDMIVDFVRLNPTATPQPETTETVTFRRRKPEESNLASQTPPTLPGVYDFIRMLDADGYPRAFLQLGDYRLEFMNAELDGNSVISTVRIVKYE